jgi:ribosomal protein S6--L-glutamate ligase
MELPRGKPGFLLLSPWSGEPTSKRIDEAARDLGLGCRIETFADGSRRDPSPVPPGMPVLPRIGQRSLETGLSRLAALERGGARPLNPSTAIERAKRKGELAFLPGLGIGRPRSALLAPGDPIPSGIDFPFVAKSPRGARGSGVHRIDSPADWQALGAGSDTPWLIERFVSPDRRREWRVLVLQGDAFASSERAPAPGEFRSNRALGGRQWDSPAPSDLLEVARRAAAAFGLGLAGIDLLVERDGEPLVVDVNDSPGLVGISRALGRDLAGELIRRWLLPRGRGPEPTSS